MSTLTTTLSKRIAAIPLSARHTAVVAVGLVVTLAAGYNAMLNGSMHAPWVVPDELIYSELAKSLAAGHAPAIRGVTETGYGVLYSLLIAPAWWVFGDVERAYATAKTVNAVVMSLTAVPVYLTARLFVGRRSSVVVAGLAVFIPSMAYTGVLLRENLFYPVFALAVLAVALALDSPSYRREVAVFGTVALAVAVQPKGLFLLGAYAGAIGLRLLLEGRASGVAAARSFLRDFRLSFGLLAIGLLAVAVRPDRAFGAYDSAVHEANLGAVPRRVALTIADLDLLVAVVPFAALLLVLAEGVRRTAPERLRLFVALFVPILAAAIVAVAPFDSVFIHNGREVLGERNVFFVAPLFFVALGLWLEAEWRPRRRLVAGAAVVAAVLPPLIPVGDVGFNARLQALAIVPWSDYGASGPLVPVTIALVSAGLAALLFLRDATSLRMPLVLAVVFMIVGTFDRASMEALSDHSLAYGVGPRHSWIDAAVGPGARVDVLWREAPISSVPPGGSPEAPLGDRHQRIFLNEFYNRSVATIYHIGLRTPYSLPQQEAVVAPNGAVRDATGSAIRPQYVLAPCSLGVVGEVVAVDRFTRMAVYRPDGPLRIGASHVRCELSS